MPLSASQSGSRLVRRLDVAKVAAGTCLLCLVTSAALSAPSKKVRPMTREEVAQAWVGLTEDELYLLRLDLRQDGTGAGAYVFTDREPQLFRVRSWSYDGLRIEMAVDGVGESGTDLETLKGALVGDAMELTMRGRGWKRRLFLRPEGDLERRWNRLRTRMAEPDE